PTISSELPVIPSESFQSSLVPNTTTTTTSNSNPQNNTDTEEEDGFNVVTVNPNLNSSPTESTEPTVQYTENPLGAENTPTNQQNQTNESNNSNTGSTTASNSNPPPAEGTGSQADMDNLDLQEDISLEQESEQLLNQNEAEEVISNLDENGDTTESPLNYSDLFPTTEDSQNDLGMFSNTTPSQANTSFTNPSAASSLFNEEDDNSIISESLRNFFSPLDQTTNPNNANNTGSNNSSIEVINNTNPNIVNAEDNANRTDNIAVNSLRLIGEQFNTSNNTANNLNNRVTNILNDTGN
ncbi:MAG: hypothetical protein KDK40_03770, partial [Chlamydiia bacterium]|nr:hypothetical protein [Chlamydiia bacterium]